MEYGKLSQEIIELLHRKQEMSAVEIHGCLERSLSLSTVRTSLYRLETKGVVARRRCGRRDLFSVEATGAIALRQACRLYYAGSLSAAALSLIEMIEAEQPGAGKALRSKLTQTERRAPSGARVLNLERLLPD